MDDFRRFEYSEKQRDFIETSVIPFAIFRVADNKVRTVLVSDGLCVLLNYSREDAAVCLEGDIYSYVHLEDVDELRKKCRSFFFGNSEVNTSFRVRFKGDLHYRTVFLSSGRMFSDTNEPMYVLWYNFVDIKDYDFEAEEQKRNFAEFLKGESNDMAFNEFGYRGYSVWNVTADTLIIKSGLGPAASVLGNDFGYKEYHSLMKGWLFEKDDMEFFEKISPESITANFENLKNIEHTFTFSSKYGQISVKISASCMKSPETADIYLKLQAENVTDSVVYETMIKSSAMVSEFMAYIDGNAGNVYFIEGENKVKFTLLQMLPVFSANLGYNFKNPQQVINYIEYKCRDTSSATVINRLSAECVKSVRLEIIDKEEKKYFICGSDVTALMKMEVNSYYDDLTGLPNMAAFRLIAQNAIIKMRNQNKIPVIVYFDLRDMKAINEKYSFERGNSVLINTAYILRIIFAGEPVSRMAEDHFVVLTDKVGLEQRIEKVYEKVLKNPMNIPVQICAGIYNDNGQNLDIDSLCDRARLACKSLKGDYNTRYKIFDSNMFEEYHKRRYILNNFDEALENNYIKVYYQPIVRCLTGNICDMEALCRWEKPDRGVVQPAQFISVLEEHRLIHKLDFYMVRKICEDIDMMRTKNFPLVPISVNLSRINFEMFDVADEVIKIVDSYRIPHKLLSIEITESAFIHNSMFLNEQINKFRSAGFEVWMDDFGSEYSSLNTLRKYNFDLIKLDMEFMKDFSLTGKNSSILSDIIRMIQKLGIHTLAEGVNAKEKLQFLRDMGCEKAQGFLFSRAMPCEYFIEKYQQNTGLGYDDFTTANYYNQIGAVRLDESLLRKNRISLNEASLGVPAAVVEYRNGKFRLLKANEEYKLFLERVGLGEQCENGDYKFWDNPPSKEFTHSAIRCLVTHSNETIKDDREGSYLVSARLICISYKYSLDIGAFAVVVEKYRKIGDGK